MEKVWAVVVATKSGTRFVSLHRTREGAARAADKYNATYTRGTRADVAAMPVED